MGTVSAAILAAAAIILALGVIWSKLVRPFARGVATFERNVPVLLEIAAQFRTDSGSSLRDAVNRLEAASVENAASNDRLRVAVEGARQLAESDRARVDRLIGLLATVDVRTAVTASDVAEVIDSAQGVAEDLAAARGRADSHTGAPGSASDAAWSRPQPDKQEDPPHA